MEEVIKPHNCLGVGDSLEVIVVALVSGIFPDDIVIEILSRLPVKSLMRFKSVCKHWSSLMEQDQQLIDLHCKRSKSHPNLLYINSLPEKGPCPEYGLWASFNSHSTKLKQSISWGEIVEGSGGQEEVEAIVSKVRITDDEWFYYDQVLEPVNGLVCFINRKTNAISVYNGSTREATPWVESTLLVEENIKLANKNSKKKIRSHSGAIYRFGFDPEKREHKVFCFWRLMCRSQNHRYNPMERPDYESWEALTVGRDTKWRRINAVPNENNHIKIKQALPPASSLARQVYVDGTIYWSNKGYYGHGFRYCNRDDPEVIVAFDVGSEKYRVIPIPNFILNDPRDKTYRLPIDMLVLGGHVALLYRMEPNVVKLWILDDRANKKLENCRGNTSNWSSETIKLPFCCDHGVGGFGIDGSADKMLFECRDYENSVSVHFVSLYSYDRRKKTCKKIEMDGVSSFTLYCRDRSQVITFTESLFPVQPPNKIKHSDVSLVSPSLEVTTFVKNGFPVQPLNMSKSFCNDSLHTSCYVGA